MFENQVHVHMLNSPHHTLYSTRVKPQTSMPPVPHSLHLPSSLYALAHLKTKHNNLNKPSILFHAYSQRRDTDGAFVFISGLQFIRR